MLALASSTFHLDPLIYDLGLILCSAGVAALIFKRLKQPLVLGYLIAGFLAGSKFDYFPTVTDIKSVKVWAEIGIIFLLFSLGLEFSFKKLLKVGGTASVTAGTQIGGMLVLGYLCGTALGWKTMDSIFLAAMLAVSSTTIILKTFEELGVKTRRFAVNVLGSLIVQDILAIIILVLLSTIAVTQSISGIALVTVIVKLVFFLTLWFITGIFFIPSLLRYAGKLITEEMLLIIAIALCLVMVILAANVGFSPALGAFVMGSIIAETTKAEQIEHLLKPVKDLFGAVFFVSVGMLIDPVTLQHYAIPVLILTLVTIFGQSILATAGSLLSGMPLKQSVQSGVSFSQIGEFSFIIATLGASLGVTSDFLYPIIVAVSAVTTFTTPYLIKSGDRVALFAERILPRKWIKNIERYSANAQSIRAQKDWHILLRMYFLHIALHASIIVAIVLLSEKFILPFAKDNSSLRFVVALSTLFAIAPFIYALGWHKTSEIQVQNLLNNKRYRGPIVMMVLFRFLLCVLLVGFLIDHFFSTLFAIILLGVFISLYLLFPKKLKSQYAKIERHFIHNLNEREIYMRNRSRSDLTPWDGHMTSFEIDPASDISGKTLEILKLRELFGVNIAYIKRADFVIPTPDKNEKLFPADEIFIIGTDEQIQRFSKFLEDHEVHPASTIADPDISLNQFVLKNETFIGKSIRDSKIREETSGIIVGIERRGNRTFNPESDMILEKNDILWIVGNRRKLIDMIESYRE
ncbi:cation:proton antiporter [Flavobacterium sp.]|uniref:cation:proton antiporter domain-containing protein n=1 Tax=Flavobacterium sp. TaxID=239 RepID=UPI003B9B122E